MSALSIATGAELKNPYVNASATDAAVAITPARQCDWRGAIMLAKAPLINPGIIPNPAAPITSAPCASQGKSISGCAGMNHG